MPTKLFLNLLKENAGAIIRWVIVAVLAYAISFGDGRYARPAQIEAAETRMTQHTDKEVTELETRTTASNNALAAVDAQIAARLLPLETLPNRVQNLEMWQADQKAAQQLDAAQFIALKSQLSTIEAQLAVQIALQKEQAKNMDRVLIKLDSLK